MVTSGDDDLAETLIRVEAQLLEQGAGADGRFHQGSRRVALLHLPQVALQRAAVDAHPDDRSVLLRRLHDLAHLVLAPDVPRD